MVCRGQKCHGVYSKMPLGWEWTQNRNVVWTRGWTCIVTLMHWDYYIKTCPMVRRITLSTHPHQFIIIFFIMTPLFLLGERAMMSSWPGLDWEFNLRARSYRITVLGFSSVKVGLESDSSHEMFVSIKWNIHRYRAYKYYADEIGSKLGFCYPFSVYSFCNHCILSQMTTSQSLGQPTHANVAWTTKVATAQKDQESARIYISIWNVQNQGDST